MSELYKLSGKRVFLICPDFLGYDKAICQALTKRGASVALHDERPSRNAIVKALIRLNPKILRYFSDHHYRKIFRNEKQSDVDVFLVVKGEAVSSETLSLARRIFPRATFIFYTWDSLKNVKHSQEKLKFFDKAFSFDLDDSSSFSVVKYLPLFFLPIFAEQRKDSQDSSNSIDLCFIGSLHSDRFSVLREILAAARKQSNRLTSFIFMYYSSRLFFYLKRCIDTNFRTIKVSDIEWQPLSHVEVVQKMSASEIIIDINHPDQSGLTMRTIESLAMGKKLITTNEKIAEEDFYHPNNILIVNRSKPEIPVSFLESRYQELDGSIVGSYSLDSWLDVLLYK